MRRLLLVRFMKHPHCLTLTQTLNQRKFRSPDGNQMYNLPWFSNSEPNADLYSKDHQMKYIVAKGEIF